MLKEVLIGISGIAAGVLLAPASGGETRSALASVLADAIEAAGDQYDAAQETFRTTARKASDLADTAADYAEEQYERARKQTPRAAKAAKQFREMVEENYSKARDKAADVLPMKRKGPSAGTVVAQFAIGAGVGFGLALLFTPKRGADLREDIADAAQNFADGIADAAQSFAGGLKKGYEEHRAAAAAGAWTGTSGAGPDYT